jgi:dihydroflavonol-4-reductase
MLHPKAAGERFIATSDGAVCIRDIADLIRKERPAKAGNIASLNGTDPDLYTTISNGKASSVLDWHPRPKEEALLATVDSL